MKTVKSISLLIITGLLFFAGCEGFMDPGSTATPVVAPVPISPPDHTENIYPAPAFTWTGTADRLQVSSDPNFTVIVFSLNSCTEQGFCMDAGILNRGQLYFWRVGKSYGNNVAWSNAYSFTMAP